MTAVKAGDVDRAVRNRDVTICLLLFYGPDSGRVSERARAAAQASVDDPADPFQLVRLDGDAVADQPGKLVDEAATYGLFGSRRAIWIRPTARNIGPAVSAYLEIATAGCLVILEAGDLQRTSPLRSACERSARALALPCYADESRDLATIIGDALKTAGLAIDADARDLLIDSLGGDRMTSQGELAKLVLYAHGRDRVSSEDVAAVVGDVSVVSVDAAIDAAFLGRASDLDANLAQLSQHGIGTGTILSGALRHALSLLSARTNLDGGQDIESALRSWRGLHFRRQAAIKTQVTAWRAARIAKTIGALQAAMLEGRQNPNLAPALTAALLFRVADFASRSARG